MRGSLPIGSWFAQSHAEHTISPSVKMQETEHEYGEVIKEKYSNGKIKQEKSRRITGNLRLPHCSRQTGGRSGRNY